MNSKVIKHLSRDKKMASLMEKHQIHLPVGTENYFSDLVETIIGQQLSVKAAKTIHTRFKTLFSNELEINAQDILDTPDEKMRETGISRQKIVYLKHLSSLVSSGELNLINLQKLSDDEIINLLTKVKGIGRWTAEMFLIFTLGRQDIFSVGDLGLKNAISNIYKIDKSDYSAILKISQKWSPYRSIASLYLWRSLDNE